jgi:hypothetical protein
VFYNGPSWDALNANYGSQQKADDLAMLRSPCVRGYVIESAFVGSGFRKSLNQHAEWTTFIPAADEVLLAQSVQKYAVPLNYIDCSQQQMTCQYGNYDPIGDRIYALAAIWLIYDPRYTITWTYIDPSADPNMTDGGGASDSLLAENEIVPTQPLQTATGNDITTLQVPDGHTNGGGPPGGVFRREFAQCYQKGASIGHCAVVLNAESTDYTNRGTVAMPTLTQSYSSSLVLNDAPADTTGTATWTGSVPTTLAPTTAVVLKQ